MMKTYTCLECGEHGCRLQVGEEAHKPMACPYKLIIQKWTQEE